MQEVKPGDLILFKPRDSEQWIPVKVEKTKMMFGEAWVKFKNAYKWMKLSEIEVKADSKTR